MRFNTKSELEAYSSIRAQTLSSDDSGNVLCSVLGNAALWVDPRDKSIAQWLIKLGYWESWIAVELGKMTLPGMLCVDAGANVGFYTALMDLQGAEVLSVEACPYTADLLKRSAERNAWRGCVVRAAIGDKRGRVKVGYEPADSGGTAVGRIRGDVYEVPMVTLDSLTNGARVDIVKMDIEGHEHKAWKGMRRTLSNPDIKVATEFNPSRYGDPEHFLSDIHADGFEIDAFMVDGLHPIKDSEIISQSIDWMILLRRKR